MVYVLQWGCEDRATLFLLLPSILEHVGSWRRTNASRISMKEKPKVIPHQRVIAAQLSPHMAGMNQINPNSVCFSLSARLQEMWRNESMLEHSNCIFTWPVLRWRMVLHSHFQESLPKCDNHIKGSVPSLPLSPPFFLLFFFCPFFFHLIFLLFFIQNEVVIWLCVHSLRKHSWNTFLQAKDCYRLLACDFIWFEGECVVRDVSSRQRVISCTKAIV